MVKIGWLQSRNGLPGAGDTFTAGQLHRVTRNVRKAAGSSVNGGAASKNHSQACSDLEQVGKLVALEFLEIEGTLGFLELLEV